MTYRNDFIVSTNDDALHDTMNGLVTGKLIRCKDCKHWSADDNETYCEELGIFGTSPNSFCSFARKKGEPTMEEFMYGQNLGNPEDGSL